MSSTLGHSVLVEWFSDWLDFTGSWVEAWVGLTEDTIIDYFQTLSEREKTEFSYNTQNLNCMCVGHLMCV